MEFSGEPNTIFVGLRLSNTVPVNRLVAEALAEVNMISESQDYLDMAAENNHVGSHWDQTRILTISEENNPRRIWYPSSAGSNLINGASGSTSSSALEELQFWVQKGSTLCFFPFVESELKHAGMNRAAEEFLKRIEAKTPTEVEDFASVKLWNHLNMPYHMITEMAHLGFTVSPSPVVYLPPVTTSFVTPQPGWKPAGINPELGVEVEGPTAMEVAPLFDEPQVVIEPNQELVCVSPAISEILLSNSNEDVKAERAMAAAEDEAEGSGGKRKAGAGAGEAVGQEEEGSH